MHVHGSGVVSYCYLGIEFAKNGSWDSHVQKVINNGKKKLNQLHRFLSNRNISTVASCKKIIVSIGTSPYFRIW